MKIRLITADGLECEIVVPGTRPRPYIKRAMKRARPESVSARDSKDIQEFHVRSYVIIGMDGDTAVYQEETK